MAEVWWQNDNRGACKASINGRFYGTCQFEGDHYDFHAEGMF